MFHRLIQLLWTIYLFNSMIPYQSSFLVISSGLGSRRSIFGNVLKTHGIFVPKTPIRLLPKFGEVIDGSLRTKLFRWPKENTIEVKPIELTSFLKSIPHFTSAASAGLLLEAPHHALQLNLKGSSNKNNNQGSQQNYQLVDIQGLNGYHGPGHDQPFSDGTYPETLTVSGNEHSDDATYLKNSGLLQPVTISGDGSEDELRLWKIKPNYQPVQFYELQSHQNISPSPLTSSTQSQGKPQMAQIGMAQVGNRFIAQNQNGQRQQGLVHNTNGNRAPVIQTITHHVPDVRPVFSGSENKPVIHPMIPCNPNLIPMPVKMNSTNTATAIIRVPVPIPMMANVAVQNQVSQPSMNQQNSQRNQAPHLTKDQVQNNERKPEFNQQNPPIIFYQPNDPGLNKVPKNQLFPIFIPNPSSYEVRSSQTTQSPLTLTTNQQQQTQPQPQQQYQQHQQQQQQQQQPQEQQVPLRNTYESNKPTATITALTLTSSSNDIKAEPAPRKRPPVRPSSHVLAIERESARSLATANKKRQTVHNYRHHNDPSSAMEYENSEETDNYRFTMPTPDSLSSDIDDLTDNLDISSDRPFSPFSSYSVPHRGHDYNELDDDSKSAASDPKGMEYIFPLDGAKIPRSRLSLTKPRPRPSSSMSTSSSPSTSSPSSSSSSIPSIKSHISIYPTSDEVKVNPEDSKATSQETSLTKSDRKTFDKGYERSKHRLFEQKVEELWKEKKWNNIGKEESEIETHGMKTEIPWISRRRDRRRPLYTDKRPLKYSDRPTYNREDESKSDDNNKDNFQSNDNSNVNGFDENESIDDKDSRKVEPNRKKDNRESNGKYNDWSAEAGSSGWRTSYRS
uniref:Uncharacterized protein n=1 Tax=Tetranychus urticae TaxID=32264 RepID=T1JU50_TETUR